jgi:predicted nucleic acid-binding protein
MYCIDASVLINSEIAGEKLHEHSEKLMEKIREKGITILVPEIVLPEISSAIARGSNNSEKALEFVKELKQIPNIVFVPIDRELADEAARFAAEYRLRGCDAIYVAVASMFSVKLISLDEQQLVRTKDCIDASTPQDELKNI